VAKISARMKAQVIVERQTVDAGPFMAEIMIMENGTMKVRSLAPTRTLRRRHEKVMKKIIFAEKGRQNDKGDQLEGPRPTEGSPGP